MEGGVPSLYLDPQENPLVILIHTPFARTLLHPPSAITCRVILLFLRHPFGDPSYSAGSHAQRPPPHTHRAGEKKPSPSLTRCKESLLFFVLPQEFRSPFFHLDATDPLFSEWYQLQRWCSSAFPADFCQLFASITFPTHPPAPPRP